ncbi:MAG: hypothetical protein U1E83_08340, partial [Methylotetracoccus sp.]
MSRILALNMTASALVCGRKVWIPLCVLTALAHFLHAGRFGLYEDDYHYIGQFLDADIASVLRLALDAAREWPQGRPLQSIVPPLLTVLAFPSGGLPSLYLLAFVITAATAVAFHHLALRLTGRPFLAAAAAIMFALFPPDTTHPFLMHAFVLRLALLCALIAGRLYLDRAWLGCYAFGFAALTLYETPFLILIGMPLLTWEVTSRRWWREAAWHVFVCALLIGITVMIRLAHAEERVVGTGGKLFDVALHLPEQLITGALTTLKQMSIGPIRRIGGWDLASDLTALIAIAPLYVWLRAAACCPNEATSSTGSLSRLAIGSMALLLSSYALSFTHAAWFTYGRLTSVHLAASVGGSMLFGVMAESLLGGARGQRWRPTVLTVMALHLALLIGYRHTIQVDFARSWDLQRWYWSNIVRTTADRTDGTLILVDGRMPQTRYINTYSWFDPLMFTLLYRIPSAWRDAPVTLPLLQESRFEVRDGRSGIAFFARPAWYPLTPGNTILLHRDGQALERVDVDDQGHVPAGTVLRSS